jgi:L-cysteine S-thiosulfotransferase
MRTKMLMGSIAAVMLALAGAPVFAQDSQAAFTERLKHDFHAKGIATLDRLDQDVIQATCSLHHLDELPAVLMRNLEQQELATVRYPADGKYMGDWVRGQALAESGKGNTWKDKPGKPNGGNCYNCHQIGPDEPSYGTIGPSLLHYGKIRGNSKEIQKYTYAKIYDSKGFNLCTAMPRFGHVGALTEQQIKDLVALLLDPESPVNR